MIRKYPIGLHRFREIREGGYVYIDKTEIIHTLVTTGKYYFLSRPSGFGKSLLVDTIKELFSGSKELFEGLWIYDKWDWSETSPVIHINFANIGVKTLGLEAAFNGALEENANRLGVSLTNSSYFLRFQELIEKTSVKGDVVILIDQHDQPIIDFLDNPSVLKAHHALLRNLHSILKESGKYIELILVASVTPFNNESIFASLNNLDDITMSSHYGALVGFTGQELEQNFAQEIAELQKVKSDILTQIQDWYNGYTWNMQTWVYNPLSLLSFMKSRVFTNYWFARETLIFLLKQLMRKKIYNLEDIRMGELGLLTFDTNNPDSSSLLFQTGYLTIKEISPSGQVFTLGFPNREVKNSFLDMSGEE